MTSPRDGDDTGGGRRDDDDRIPGEENSPFWVDRDPFLDRRTPSRTVSGSTSTPEASEKPPTDTPAVPRDPAEISKPVEAPEPNPSPRPIPKPTSRATPAAERTQTKESKAEADPEAKDKVAIDPALLAEARVSHTPKSSPAPEAPAATPRDAPTPAPTHAEPAPVSKASEPKAPTPAPAPATPPVRTAAPASRATTPATPAKASPPPPSTPRRDELPGDGRRPRRRFLLPIWAWVLIAIAGTAALLAVLDLRTSHRFRLICQSGQLHLQRAKRFPWPFGFETLGGNLRPVSVVREGDCLTQHFADRDEAEGAFLSFVLTQVRATISNPASRNLNEAQAQIEQVRALAAKDAHAARAKEVKQLLADLSYRGGRARLARVEMTLREALALFQRAQKLGGERYEDLEDWIAHLERLLRSVAPTPGAPQPGLPKTPMARPAIPGVKPGIPTTGRVVPRGPPLLPGKAPPAHAADGGAAKPDAGVPGGGILM